MIREKGTSHTGPVPLPKREGKGVFRFLFPSRDKLQPHIRLGFGGAVNIILAAWVSLHLGHMRDPDYSMSNALWASLEVVIPCAALLALLPVFLFGRDVPRLMAIGLSFLPAYVAIIGFGQALSLWLNGG